jgi:hypothetical protein
MNSPVRMAAFTNFLIRIGQCIEENGTTGTKSIRVKDAHLPPIQVNLDKVVELVVFASESGENVKQGRGRNRREPRFK